MLSNTKRKLIHIDMDAFYASVEQRDQPDLRGKPVIVGGQPDSRGVVAACSYEARQFGVHSAMPSATAYRLCPNAVFIKPAFEKYQAVSRQVQAIFREFTDLVESLSLDEAFLDISTSKRWQGSATLIAKEIKSRIKITTDLTASAGVSYNKFLAKIASDMDKPDGLFVITPEQGEAFIEQLPIGKFFGIGKATEARMKKLGIYTGADIKKWPLPDLLDRFGKHGKFYYDIARGIDNRPVNPKRKRQSISTETTLQQDISDKNEMLTILFALAEKISISLEQQQLLAKTLFIKIKFADFTQCTRSRSLPNYFQSVHLLKEETIELLSRVEFDRKPVRLLGVGVSHLIASRDDAETEDQFALF